MHLPVDIAQQLIDRLEHLPAAVQFGEHHVAAAFIRSGRGFDIEKVERAPGNVITEGCGRFFPGDHKSDYGDIFFVTKLRLEGVDLELIHDETLQVPDTQILFQSRFHSVFPEVSSA